jgi:hypothetical protein
MTSIELDVHQALSTLERVLGVATLRPATLRALRDAYERLKADPAR